MQRRTILRSLLSVPAITALPAQTPQPQKTPEAHQKLPPEMKPPQVEETPKLAMTNAEAALTPAPHFFTRDEHDALAHLCDLLVPATASKPGAKDAAVADFLDFLIGHSPSARQSLYRQGLDTLNKTSQRKFGKAFTAISADQAAELLSPLGQPWTFQPPSDPLAAFLVAAKDDVLKATVNSREWAAASTGRRAGGGVGAYWYSME